MVRLSSIYINEYWNSEEEQEGKCWYSMKDEKVYFINELEERFRGKEKDWQIRVIQIPEYNGELKTKSFVDKFYKLEFEKLNL